MCLTANTKENLLSWPGVESGGWVVHDSYVYELGGLVDNIKDGVNITGASSWTELHGGTLTEIK
jgi:hypothetical protein